MQSYPAIHLALHENARKDAKGHALFFADSDLRHPLSITNEDLLAEVQGLAAALLDQGLTPQDRVLLMFEPSLAYAKAFLACLYAGLIAIPCYPPRSRMQLKQITGIIKNSGPRLVLMDAKVHSHLKKFEFLQLFTRALWIRDFICLPLRKLRDFSLALTPWFVCDDRFNAKGAADLATGNVVQDVAFLQYTSGSTGFPKGVVVSHRQLIRNIELIHQQFKMSPQSRGVIWLPPYHDMGLIGGILAPLYGGFPVFLLAPNYFLRSPLVWLRAISEFRATISGGPNFAYDLACKRVKPEQMKELDLSCWELAFTGAEPIKWKTLERFHHNFKDCGFSFKAFYPCYGLAESTLFVTGKKFEQEPTALSYRVADHDPRTVILEESPTADSRFGKIVSCGELNDSIQVKVVDEISGLEVSEGQIGEIWLQGESVGMGYWNQAELNQRQFGQGLPGASGAFMRTGDLGFIHKNHLYVTGRLKDLIIIDGRNIYPQDIESAVEDHVPGIRIGSTAAISLDYGDTEKIVYLVEVYPDRITETLQSDIRHAISRTQHVPVDEVVFLPPNTLPKTTSGKIRRSLAKDLYRKGALKPLPAHKAAST
jgi:acyl-CoA synthetase (AMP-forming)/AMP-acid ligase II